MRIKTLLADKGEVALLGLRAILEPVGRIAIVGEARNAGEMQAMITGLRPDVVLVDLDMPGMDGIECIGHIAQERLARAVVVVSALDPALLNTVQTMARAYGLRVPFTDIVVAGRTDPARGEIVVFDSPVDGTRLIKRVAAVAGDRETLRDGSLLPLIHF